MRRFDQTTFTRRDVLAGASAAAVAGVLPAHARAPLQNTPAPGYYRFKIGSFEATVVTDGPLTLGNPSPEVFPGLTNDAMTKGLADNFLPADKIVVEQNALVVNTGDRLVLLDTGLGSSKAFGNDSGRLLANLKVAGFDAKDFDDVVLTHTHPDHCWALIADDGTRNFPNAQIRLSQADFDFWTDESKATGPLAGLKPFIDGTRKQLLPNRDRLVFVKDGQEVLPGIQAMAAPGHTVGHTIYLITSQGKTFCNAGDIAHHHVLMVENPQVWFSYDTDGKQAVASRLRVFDMLAGQHIPFVAYHFPWPGLGHLAKNGSGGYRYVPASLQTIL